MPPKSRTEVGDLVGEGDQRREERVRSIFDHLGGTGVRPDARGSVEGTVKLFENLDGAFIDAAEHYSIRMHELLDGFAFGKKFRVHPNPKIDAGFLAGGSLERRQHVLIRRAGHNAALYHDDVIAGFLTEHSSDLVGSRENRCKIDSLAIERRSHRDQGGIGFQNGSMEVGGRGEVASRVPGQEIFEFGFEERSLAAVECVNPPGIDIHARYMVTFLSEAGAGYQSDVTRADDGDFHQASEASRLPEYHTSERWSPSSSETRGSYPSSARALAITGQRRLGLSTR